MATLKEKWAELRTAYNRLSQREQVIVLGGAAFVVFFVVGLMGWGMSSAIDKAERRVKVKKEALMQVLQLQGEYKTRQREHAAQLRLLTQSSVRLVSHVEEVAKQAGVELGQLRPEESEPNPDGIVESRVDIRASGLSADKLQDFLQRLEQVSGVVVIRRIRMHRPYQKDTVDLELTINTYKQKS